MLVFAFFVRGSPFFPVLVLFFPVPFVAVPFSADTESAFPEASAGLMVCGGCSEVLGGGADAEAGAGAGAGA